MGQLVSMPIDYATRRRLYPSSGPEMLPSGCRGGGLRLQGYEKRSTPAEPLITVITAVFNGAATVAQAIESVLSQTYGNVEYLVVDGGSSDATPQILNQYSDGIDLWTSEPDAGIYDAWNKGLKRARGEFISFIGADDRLLPGGIEDYVAYLRSGNMDKEYVSSRVRLVRGGRVLRTLGSAWRWKVFGRYMNVAHVGSLHSRRLFERVGSFNPEYRIAGDYELLLRARETLRAGFIDIVTAEMTAGGASNSNRRVFAETYAAKIGSGGRSPARCRLEALWAQTKFEIRRALQRC